MNNHYCSHNKNSILQTEAPDFGKTRAYHEFLVNQTVTVPCVVSGKPDVEVQWYRNDRIINDDGRGDALAAGSSAHTCGTGVSTPS